MQQLQQATHANAQFVNFSPRQPDGMQKVQHIQNNFQEHTFEQKQPQPLNQSKNIEQNNFQQQPQGNQFFPQKFQNKNEIKQPNGFPQFPQKKSDINIFATENQKETQKNTFKPFQIQAQINSIFQTDQPQQKKFEFNPQGRFNPKPQQFQPPKFLQQNPNNAQEAIQNQEDLVKQNKAEAEKQNKPCNQINFLLQTEGSQQRAQFPQQFNSNIQVQQNQTNNQSQSKLVVFQPQQKTANQNLFITERVPQKQPNFQVNFQDLQKQNQDRQPFLNNQPPKKIENGQYQPLQLAIPNNKFFKIEMKDYKQIKLLGQGSFGIVYLVENEAQEKFALKIQKDIKQAEMEILQKFKQKKFKNVVNTIAVTHNEQTKEYYVLMEYCETSLQDFMLFNILNPEECRYIVKQISQGIKEIHDFGIIHRDIKPENILIFQMRDPQNPFLIQNLYKICDFGLSCLKDFSKTTQLGTAHYMPPEQIEGAGYDKSVDIWALGTVIYEIFTRSIMFYAKEKNEIFEQIKNISQEEINKKISDGLLLNNVSYVDLVKQMVSKDPKQRPTIDQVIQATTTNNQNRKG